MLGSFFAGFEKRAEEKKKRSAAARGAFTGAALGTLPGNAMLLASRFPHTGVPNSAIASRYLTGMLAGAGIGGLAGGALDLARKHKKKKKD